MIFIHKNQFNTVIDGKELTYYKIVLLDDKKYDIVKCTKDVYNTKLNPGSEYEVFYDKYGRVASLMPRR